MIKLYFDMHSDSHSLWMVTPENEVFVFLSDVYSNVRSDKWVRSIYNAIDMNAKNGFQLVGTW